MHNYVAAQGSPHREEMCPSLQGEGDRGAGKGGVSLGGRLGLQQRPQGPGANAHQGHPCLTLISGQLPLEEELQAAGAKGLGMLEKAGLSHPVGDRQLDGSSQGGWARPILMAQEDRVAGRKTEGRGGGQRPF